LVDSRFATTQWSRVIAARDGAGEEAREALTSLCEAYWYPLYAFVRRKEGDAETARDLTQAYFAELLETEMLRAVSPSAGRFRSFLLASLEHFLSHEREKARALKRGGGVAHLSLDALAAENRYRHEPADDLTPAEIFERRWALAVLERALERLRQEERRAGTGDRFERLKSYLTGLESTETYREVAADLGITEVAARGAVHRLRKRFGRVLRAEIGETVVNPEEVDDEVRHLLSILGSRGSMSA
jgi:RNA polymerase sigma-70 factor (ECF subfamily)